MWINRPNSCCLGPQGSKSWVCCALSEYKSHAQLALAGLEHPQRRHCTACQVCSAIPLPSARVHSSAAYRRQYHCVLHFCCPSKYTSSPVLHVRIRNDVSLETSSSSEGRSRKVRAEARMAASPEHRTWKKYSFMTSPAAATHARLTSWLRRHRLLLHSSPAQPSWGGLPSGQHELRHSSCSGDAIPPKLVHPCTPAFDATEDAKPWRRTQSQVEAAHGEVDRQRLGACVLEDGGPQVGHDEEARRCRRAADQDPPHDLQEAARR